MIEAQVDPLEAEFAKANHMYKSAPDMSPYEIV